MTNKEILQASLLDIIFENRNKEYGAYALRNGYDKRLLTALGFSLGLVLLLILLSFLRFNSSASQDSNDEKDGFTLTKVIEMEPEKHKQPELPRPIEKPIVAQVDHQTIRVVPDHQLEKAMVNINDIADDAISDKDVAGKPDTEPRNNDLTTKSIGDGEMKTLPEPEKPVIKIPYRAPQYPGGFEALNEFFKNNLTTPEELEPGDKRLVKVKFTVGIDGKLSDITILESPDKRYDKEVTRVLRKMKNWEPAIQNDMHVTASFILPVTFIVTD
jgi:protein TonB